MVVRGLRRCIKNRAGSESVGEPADDLLEHTRRRLGLCPDRVTGPTQRRKSQKRSSRYNRSVTGVHASPRNEALKTPFVPRF